MEQKMKPFIVHLNEVGNTSPTVFDCWADDADHAKEQAENSYPGCQINNVHCIYTVIERLLKCQSHPNNGSSDQEFKVDRQQVYNWDAQHYSNDTPNSQPFVIDVVDQRRQSGQLFVDVGSESGPVEDVLIASFEINQLPGSSVHVQCMHVHFDSDRLAFSLFKQGDEYILRPEVDVKLESTRLPDKTSAFIIK